MTESTEKKLRTALAERSAARSSRVVAAITDAEREAIEALADADPMTYSLFVQRAIRFYLRSIFDTRDYHGGKR